MSCTDWRKAPKPVEIEAVKWIANNKTRAEVAHIMGMSLHGIDSALHRFSNKTGVYGVANMTRWAIKHGHVTI